ncbi:MAG TPA: hypothetical protein PLP17_14905 [Oligoflexia bacterium]|nr:hypothetical protein [Oligoflexia bacterium]
MNTAEEKQLSLLLDEMRRRLEALERQIEIIQSRNQRVEADKAWEVSGTRVLFLVLATYVVTAIVFFLIGVPNCLRNALIPTIGYFLSTQSLPLVRKWWLSTRSTLRSE